MNTYTKGLVVAFGGSLMVSLLVLGFGATLHGVYVEIVADLLIFIAFCKFLYDN